MRIAYLTWQPMDRHDGVVSKIASQLRIWRSSGHEVRLFGFSASRTMWSGANDVPHQLVPCGNLWQRNGRARHLAGLVQRWQPELVFFRMAAFYPALEPLLKKTATVVDINTNDLAEVRASYSPWLYAYYKVLRKRLLNLAHGVTAVTDELLRSIRAPQADKTMITNGIDLEQCISLPAPSTETRHLFFLGSAGRSWHGTDKILQLAARRPAWQFHLVGPRATELGFPLPDNVITYGNLGREAYLPIMAQCDLALASLAMHRNGLDEASPLKVREYLAHGLPVVTGYLDADFPEGAPFILQLPNTPDNITHGVETIDDFLRCWRGKRVDRRCTEHLDIHQKEQQRLDFLRHVLKESHGQRSVTIRRL